MRHLLILSITLLFIFSCNKKQEKEGEQNKEGFKITGKSEIKFEDPVVVNEILGRQSKIFDTLNISEDGNISLSGKVNNPKLCMITIKETEKPFLIKNGEKLKIHIKGSKEKPEISVTGSEEVNAMEKIFAIRDSMRSKAQSINQKFILARNKNDKKAMDSLRSEMQKIQNSRDEISSRISKIAKKFDAPSFVRLYGSMFIDAQENFKKLDSLASIYKKEMPDYYYTKQLVKKVEKARKKRNSNVAVGKKAPDFTVPTPDGKKIKLSDFRGKYVLIDFWASWCKPCRMANPHVVKLYKKYRDENFEIIGVSLDKKRQAWIKAIKNDNLMWKHGSRLQGWQSPVARKYEVQGIPYTVLVNPDGKIIAKKLRGKALDNKLKELFANS